ncbi:MAG: GntR family transcriptional regulator [Clostridium butyricum]|nr:GntR family transcriptional regulator [Clostridium butyricum]
MEKLGLVKRNKSLADRAYEVIREAIIYNKLKPGEILAEEKFAKELQISRTPIRSALSKLVFEEIAYIDKNKNVIVSDITQKDIDDIAFVRESLEPLAVSLLKDKITKEQIEELKYKYIEEVRMLEDKKGYEFIELDYEFHIAIAECTGNSFLNEMIKKTNLIAKRFLILSGAVPQYRSIANQEHKEIIDYIENGDFKKASESMLTHLKNVKESMLKNERY